MNYHTIKKHDISNGPGVRVSLFVSGCTHHCKGCFNPETWSFASGEEFTDSQIAEIHKALDPDYIRGLSLLGGEPFERVNADALFPFVADIQLDFNNTKSVWAYSGYKFEEIVEMKGSPFMLLQQCDVLVDGEFMEDQKVVDLRFRGSTNQRIIDVQNSLRAGKVVDWEEDK